MYMREAFKAEESGDRDKAIGIFKKGFEAYKRKLMEAINGVSLDDVPLVIALMENSAEALRKSTPEVVGIQVDAIKNMMKNTVVAVPIKFTEGK